MKKRGLGRPFLGAHLRRVAVEALLAGMICMGVSFRFRWLDWSQGMSLHPDEYGLANTLSQLAVPDSLAEYFNTRLSPLSPYQKYDVSGRPTTPGPDNRMRWGQWPITCIRWAAEKTGRTGYSESVEVGRRISALADSLTLLLLFLIGRRLYGRGIALLATALSALSVMQIQQCHFMTVDMFAVFFATAAMYCGTRAIRPWSENKPPNSLLPAGNRALSQLRIEDARWHALFGLAAGMAVASRINMVPLIGIAPVAVLIAGSREWRARPAERSRIAAIAFLHLSLALMVALVTFRIAHPMAFRAESGDTAFCTLNLNPDWVESMKLAAAGSNLEVSDPPAEQWTGRRRLLFPLLNMVVWGMGLPLGLSACAGLAWATRRAIHGGERGGRLLTLLWTGGYLLYMGTRRVTSMRYLLPIYPFMALLAAWALVELWKKADAGFRSAPPTARSLGRLRQVRSVTAAVSIAAVILGTFAWARSFTGVYRNLNTRIEASRWILDHVPGAIDLRLQAQGGPLEERLPVHGTSVAPGVPLRIPFRVRQPSIARSISMRALSSSTRNVAHVLHVVLSADPEGGHPLAQAEVILEQGREDLLTVSGASDLGPAALEAGRDYHVVVTNLGVAPVAFAGSTVANESWDESLPLPLEGRHAVSGLYRSRTMEVRWPDSEVKRRMFVEGLAESDYIILPSQRALWSVSRMPNNYPMTLEYYRALFDGRLGFELSAQFHRPFQIGPLRFSDLTGEFAWKRIPRVPVSLREPFDQGLLAAEEAFSVYDHAPVWIFHKRSDFSAAKACAVLDAVDLGRVFAQSPRAATVAPTALMMPDDRLREQQAGGTWREMFDPNGILNRRPVLGAMAWYCTLLLAGFLAFPITFIVFNSLPDKGYPLAKTMGMLAVAWTVWTMGSWRILAFARPAIILGILMVATLSLIVLCLRRRELWIFLRRRLRYIAVVELLFLALFLFDLFIRIFNPDLWHPYFGGEKPMVMSYFNAVLKSTSFPPYDPWLAGGYMNYYYFGLVVAGQLVKLLGIVPSISYNLIIPSWFALAGTGAFCVAYNLTALKTAGHSPAKGERVSPDAAAAHGVLPASGAGTDGESRAAESRGYPNPYLAGVGALLLAVVLGNLAQAGVLAAALQGASGRPPQSAVDMSLPAVIQGAARVLWGGADIPLSLGNWYWDASRIVSVYSGGNEINEFPFFTFLYADMHAHMLDMPILLLVLAWAVALALPGQGKRPAGDGVLLWLLGGLALGAIRATNTWDFPTCLALSGMALLMRYWYLEHRPVRERVAIAAWKLLLLGGLSFLLYQPFDHWFAGAVDSAELWEGTKTSLAPYLFSHGLFLFVLVTLLVLETIRWLAETPASYLSEPSKWLPPALLGLVAVCVCVCLTVFLGVTAALIAMPIIAWSSLLLLRSRERLDPGKRIVIFLLGAGMALTVAVELIAVGGDRMNTMFKFYLQVWLLLAVAAGPALSWIWADRKAWTPGLRRLWTGGLCLLAAMAALYPVTATVAKVRDRFPPATASDDAGASAGCQPIPGIPIPYPGQRSLAVENQPRGLDGAAFMRWSAYCDRGGFLPLKYDYDALRWIQDHVPGSPVIVEAQSFELYRMSGRYSWFTGLPNVVGWDWHQRQQRAAINTQFVTDRGTETGRFYTDHAVDHALAFISKYNVSYIIVGPLEHACYRSSGGLEKFDSMAATGLLSVAYRNPGVVIYQVAGPAPPG